MKVKIRIKKSKAFQLIRIVGGTVEIQKIPDEPGRNWVKVRWHHLGGAGGQFEVWDDEMHLLEHDIRTNFQGGGNLRYLPLPPPGVPSRTLAECLDWWESQQRKGRSGAIGR